MSGNAVRNLLFVIVLATFSTAAKANKVWECVNAQGSHVYQDQPCADNPEAGPVHGYDTKPKYSNNQPLTAPKPVQPAVPVASYREPLPAFHPAVGGAPVAESHFPASLVAIFVGIAIVVGALTKGKGRSRRPRTYSTRDNRKTSTGFRVEPTPSKAEPAVSVPIEPRPPVKTNSRFVKGRFLSKHEIDMFRLLQSVMPESWCVLTQVSMGQIIRAVDERGQFDYGHWHRVSQKAVDFVICRPDMSVVLVIELDDRSHLGNEKKDHERDGFLLEAGIATRRFYHVPPITELRLMMKQYTAS